MNAINLSENTYIATDSKEIQSHALSFTTNIVMTSPDHISGTDRICEAAGYLDINDEDLVINLQGDEPFMPLDLITNIINDFYTNDCDVISACNPLDKDNDIVIIQSISFLKPVLFMKFKHVYYFNIEQMTIYTDYLENTVNTFIPQRVMKNILNPYFKLDKEYYNTYLIAKKAGVNFLAYRCDISSKKIFIDKKLKIIDD